MGQELGSPAKEIFEAATQRLISERYNRRVMSNLIRPHYVEFMVAAILGDEWELVSGDWSGWDLVNKQGARIEVKQSAALQTWTGRVSLEGRTTPGTFDIARRKGYWVEGGAQHIPFDGRTADLFVFAWHPITDPSYADHRDVRQWRFFVVREDELPMQKTVRLSIIQRRWNAVGYLQLPNEIASILEGIATLKCQAVLKDPHPAATAAASAASSPE